MNEAIKQMLAKPGLHRVSNTGFEVHHQYFVVEVTADGQAYQLNPAGVRDGLLDPAGWHDDAIEIF